MKNPFARAGFDSLIAEGTTISGNVFIKNGQTLIIDGKVTGMSLVPIDTSVVDKTTVVINGEVIMDTVGISNATITGSLTCKVLSVEGQLAIKAGASVKASEIRYRTLVIEPGAIVFGQMNHLDHISAGEQV
jgi:cytoskeletal protein CcmA (bactofilin family)